MKRRRLWVVGGAVLLCAVAAMAWAGVRASNSREWVLEQRVQPAITFNGDTAVTVRHVRNFDWTAADSAAKPSYYDRVYDLRRVTSASYIVTPFSDGWRGPAHTFVSFGFDDSTYVAISVEARKEVGETYSIAKGMLKRFEVMYVIADERDVIPLRTHKWRDNVILYPVKATPAQASAMLAGMLRRAHSLETKPEFYGSLRNNCTTNILDELNRLRKKPVRYGWKVLLPGYSDQLAMETGLIDTSLPIDSARAAFRINEKSAAFLGDPHYSTKIRQ